MNMQAQENTSGNILFRESGTAYRKQAISKCQTGAWKEAIHLLDKAMHLDSIKGDTSSYLESLLIHADAQWKLGNIDEAKAEFYRIYEYEKHANDSLVFETCISLVRLFNHRGKYEEAYPHLQKAKKHANTRALEAVYLNAESVFFKLVSKYEQAIESLQKAIAINKERKYEQGLAMNYSSLGNVYLKLRDNEKALEYFKLAYEIEERLGNTDGKIQKAVNLSAAYFRLGKYRELIALLIKTKPQARKVGNIHVSEIAAFNLGLCYEQNAQYSLALKEFEQALSWSLQMKSIESIFRNYQRISYIQAKLGNYKQAYRLQLKVNAYKDSLKQNDFRLKLGKIQNDKRLVEADLEQEKLRFHLKENQNKLLTKQRNFLIVISVGILLFVGLFFILAYIRRKQRSLAKQKQELQTEVKRKENTIHSKSQIIGKLGKTVKYTRQELEQMVFLLQESYSLVETLDNKLQHLVDSSRLAKVHQLPLFSSLDMYRNLVKQHPALEFQFKNKDGDMKARIKQAFPDLSKNEEEMCLMLKLGFSTREIAARNNTIHKSVEVARYRMRKRLGFDSNESFMKKLNQL